MLRIVAGVHGSRRIEVPAGKGTRPTSDRVREAVFSMLGPVTGLRVLDLFAGSGAMAIEAMSRGAGDAVLVDSAPGAVRCIRANLDLLGIDAEVLRSDWGAALRRLAADGSKFDLVFVDPPYADAGPILEGLGSMLESVLAPGATVVCETAADMTAAPALTLQRERRYGATLIRLYGNE